MQVHAELPNSALKLFYALIVYLQMCEGVQNLTAQLGADITLPCQAPSHRPIVAVEWTRPDLDPDIVFFYLDGKANSRQQHPSFHGRVGLVQKQMNNSNVSLVLRNVTSSDGGTYECRVKEDDGKRRTIRGVIESSPLSTIALMVEDPGPSGTDVNHDGRVGLIVGLTLGVGVPLLLLLAGAVVIYSNRSRGQNRGQGHIVYRAANPNDGAP